VAAVAALRDLGVQVRLGLLGSVFPGYEWFERELRERVTSQGLDAQVEFIGFDPDIWAHMAAADIICVPSTVDEPFGNTAVEAMLAQRPLIVSDTSGLKEAAGGFASARFVRPDDPAAIVVAVQDMIAHWPDLCAVVAEDRRLAIARYDPAVYRLAIIRTLAG
jgi:glycosyltransferase involved in cell wall biosynthesis